MSTEKDRDSALRKQAFEVMQRQAGKKKRPKERRVYAYEEHQKPQIFKRIEFGHPRQIVGCVWPGEIDPNILAFM